MAKGYQPENIESRHYERWEKAGYFKPAAQGQPHWRDDNGKWRIAHGNNRLLEITEKPVKAVKVLFLVVVPNCTEIDPTGKMLGIIVNQQPRNTC